MSLRIVISAGEVSGDRHLSKVVAALKARSPESEIRGMAGPESQAAGARLDVDCYRTGSTMGFGQVVRSAGKILKSFRSMATLVREWRPDVLLLVDYPDFNMRLAKVAHKSGCKVLYYIPPKVWAWRSSRVEQIKRHVDLVAAIFPFERGFFEKRGYDRVRYVGHPLGDLVSGKQPQSSNTLLMLPGSRKFEVEKILPPMLRVFERLRKTRPRLVGEVLVAPNLSVDGLRGKANEVVSAETLKAISWSKGDALEAMRRARAGILKSGTCNLEGAVAALPFVSVYSGSWLSKVIASALVPLTEYSPVNIMKPGSVKEVFAVTIDEDVLEQEVAKVLDDGPERERMVGAFQEIQRDLRSSDESVAGDEKAPNVPRRVADLVVSLGGGGLTQGPRG